MAILRSSRKICVASRRKQDYGREQYLIDGTRYRGSAMLSVWNSYDLAKALRPLISSTTKSRL